MKLEMFQIYKFWIQTLKTEVQFSLFAVDFE